MISTLTTPQTSNHHRLQVHGRLRNSLLVEWTRSWGVQCNGRVSDQ
jgi:hypothetical protein